MPRRPSNHVDDPIAVGQRLRQAREAAGLTQRELSFEGCTAAYVSRIEAGARVPSLQILHEFAKRLAVTPEYLATGRPGGEDVSSELLEAEVALRLGDENRAAQLYEAARADADSPAALARVQLGLGRLALRRDEIAEGIELLEEAIRSRELAPGDASAAANALGRGYVMQSRYDDAFAIFDRFLDEARVRGDHFDEVRFSVLLANAYIDHGDYGRAHATLGEVLEIARQTVDPLLRASLYWSQLLAFIENDRGNPEAALELVDEGEPIVAAAGEAVTAAMFTIERARALSALGEGEEAAELLLGIVPRLNAAAPKDAARAYAAVADVFRKQGDTARALELYELAVEQAPIPDRHVVAALTAMAGIHEEQGNGDMALELLKRALAARTATPA